MKAVSTKRAAEQRIYMKRRALFLAEHESCVCGAPATEVHHKRGRVGALYLDVTHWLAMCHGCHVYVTEHPREAIARGLSERRIGRAS